MSLIVLTLCLAAVIQLRSSQPTVATEQDIDVGGTSGQTDHILSVLNQLVSSMSEIQSGMTQLQTAVAELQSSNARLQSDVAELNVVFSRRGKMEAGNQKTVVDFSKCNQFRLLKRC